MLENKEFTLHLGTTVIDNTAAKVILSTILCSAVGNSVSGLTVIMDAVVSSQTSMHIYQITRRRIP
jgi:hypothetical protein